jgi:hypothetical protein
LAAALGLSRSQSRQPVEKQERDPEFQPPRQCEQMPAISISGLFGENPAARADDLSASAAAPPGASPTAPHFSQIKKTTRSSSP